MCCDRHAHARAGYILSTVADLVSNADPNAVKIEEKLSELRVYLRWHKFPPELATRVRRYYEYYYSRKSAMDEEEIIDGLAPSLRREVGDCHVYIRA